MTNPSTAFRDFLHTFLRANALPSDKFGHQPRLYQLTRLVGEGLVYDDDVVYAASYLHDLGVFIGHRPENPEQLARWNHVAYAVDHAPAILQDAGFPQQKIPAVLIAMEQHQPADTPTTNEAIVLRDADILEQLGAIGILRACAKVGRDTRYPSFTDAVAALRKVLDELPGKILLPTTRALAEPKIAVLRSFLNGVDAESHGALF